MQTAVAEPGAGVRAGRCPLARAGQQRMAGRSHSGTARESRAVNRIYILGSSGAGKSVLARRLGDVLGLDVFHLDTYFWGPGWTEPDLEVFRGAVREVIARDSWIV